MAGSSTSGFSGDGGAATAATIYNPWGVALDAAGNLYIGDGTNNRIRRVSAAGIITTYAGTGAAAYGGDGGPATAAQLKNPSGVALDTMGNLYISDANNHRIRKITPSGIISTFAGTGSAGFSGDGGPATAAQIVFSDGIAADRYGNVYIPDPSNHRIRRIDASGLISTFAGNGSIGSTGDGGAATAATINYPSDIEVDNAGIVYFTDYQENIVRKINTAGVISKIAGVGTPAFSGDGGPATAAELSHPIGIDVDNCGNIYIGDALNGRVRKIDASGNISTIAGNGSLTFGGDGGPATAASINEPHAICHDGNNNLYIADRLNSRVRKITYPVNSIPRFFYGSPDSFSVCINGAAVHLDSLLAVTDSNAGQIETLSIYSNASHGMLSGFSTSFPSTGGFTLPSGLTYTPTAGYSGNDTFRISLSDCLATTIKTVYVKVKTLAACKATVASQHISNDGLFVFPNPNHGSFGISLTMSGNEEGLLTISNVLGEKVKQLSVKTNQLTEIQLNVPTGLYFISAVTNDARFMTNIIVE